jgi:hypothetical protein
MELFCEHSSIDPKIGNNRRWYLILNSNLITKHGLNLRLELMLSLFFANRVAVTASVLSQDHRISIPAYAVEQQ